MALSAGLLAWLLSATLFAGMWAVSVRVRNYGFLDVTWSYMIGVLALLAALTGAGAAPERLLVPLLGVLWSGRLGTFILRRVLRHHPHEDKRYQTLRKRYPSAGAFLLFFELQAAIAVVFALPFLLASRTPQPAGLFEWVGLACAAVSLCGEGLADAQASAFKHRRQASGILDTGLWRYSRHPNYFFEFLFWVGIAVAVLDLPWGWMCLACPALIGYFLLRVTGIPLTEQHSLETHGDAYRDYQQRTSAFVPWFPKEAAATPRG